MRLIVLAASEDDGMDWLDRYVDTANVERTNDGAVADVYGDRAVVIDPTCYDQLGSVFDPNAIQWLSGGPTKIIRTNAWPFDLRVVNALRALHARHPLCDPTGLLGPDDVTIDRRRGWSASGRTVPMGVLTQRMAPRPKPSRRKSGLTGAGLHLPR